MVVEASCRLVEHEECVVPVIPLCKQEVDLLERHCKQEALFLPTARAVWFGVDFHQGLEPSWIGAFPEPLEHWRLLRRACEASLVQLCAQGEQRVQMCRW